MLATPVLLLVGELSGRLTVESRHLVGRNVDGFDLSRVLNRNVSFWTVVFLVEFGILFGHCCLDDWRREVQAFPLVRSVTGVQHDGRRGFQFVSRLLWLLQLLRLL